MPIIHHRWMGGANGGVFGPCIYRIFLFQTKKYIHTRTVFDKRDSNHVFHVISCFSYAVIMHLDVEDNVHHRPTEGIP